jgi:phage repressor protein C with HTH and peptisase S24 domain
MINGVRLAERLQAADLSQSELARRVGISQQTVHKLVTGQSRGSTHIATIARELGTSPAYLTGVTDNPAEGAPPVPTEREIAKHLDLVPIASVDQAYGMGATFADDGAEVEVLHFPKTWIEQLTHSAPASLTWARGKGDSMAPTINDNDMVLIDRSERRVEDQDLIWCFTIGDMAMIKRLRVRGDKVTIMSDNKDVANDTAHPDEINIIGRITRVVKPV